MVEIEIDGKKVEVQEGSMVMDAANKVGTYIPHFCYHKKLSIAANCRMCLVDVEKAPKPLPACATPVTNGMIVRTASDKAIKAQKSVMEFLLINHPLDCPICDQGGECQLQDLAVGYGPSASRYAEEKRVVDPKDAGPLISMREMARCIHCTRCVRFGQEIGGVMEFGMLNRGEHSEITTFVGNSVDSELSGNMIDLCPVGALTSKPFRYAARTWEMSRRRSVSPHDSLGSNLMVQVKGGKVLRVLPLENESINECWLSDRDRFSYDGLNSDDRLIAPMIKQDGKWIETDWQTALEYVAHGLRDITAKHGADSLAALAAPYSTLEEFALLQKLVRGLGSDNIDFRLRQSDFALDGKLVPWLGMPVEDINLLGGALLVGSFLRKDHPLIAARVRKAAKGGAQINVLHGSDEDLLMPVTNKLIVAPSAWVSALGEIAVAVAHAKGVQGPRGVEGINPSEAANKIATSLVAGENRAVLLGSAAIHHPQASQLHALAQWIAHQVGARFGYLTEGGNALGGYLANALPGKGANALQAFAQPRKAYMLLHAEPELDCYDPQAARAALSQADMVVVMAPYKQGMDYADVLLPIAPFTETAGTFVNCEGRAQGFNGSAKALGETRPAWKVLRVLGNLLGMQGFNYETSEEIRAEVLGVKKAEEADLSARLNNFTDLDVQPVKSGASGGLERLADVPIYFSDAIARRSPPLQQTSHSKPPLAWLSAELAQQLGVTADDKVRVRQGQGEGIFAVGIDPKLPATVVKVSAAHPTTSTLGGMFGPVSVERA
ncbi:MAG TPA: NADH-quinone oxidoreductase subunit NuoG [Noviherbaspirillum sp.]